MKLCCTSMSSKIFFKLLNHILLLPKNLCNIVQQILMSLKTEQDKCSWHQKCTEGKKTIKFFFIIPWHKSFVKQPFFIGHFLNPAYKDPQFQRLVLYLMTIFRKRDRDLKSRDSPWLIAGLIFVYRTCRYVGRRSWYIFSRVTRFV